MPTFFLPFSSLNIDGPKATSFSRMNDISLWEDYNEAIPGPQNAALPRRSLSVVTKPALTGKCLGVASFALQNGDDIVIAGDSAALYKAYSTVTATFTFSDISKAGGYAAATGETWEFASYRQGAEAGIQRIIATDFTDHVQCIGVRGNVSTTVTFSDLITSSTKPKARHLGIIGQFLVLGNTDQATSSTAALTPFRVHWSAFGNPLSFTPAASTQCDFEDLQTGGAVQKIVSGNEYGLIMQENQVQVMRYTGGTTIFDFSPVAYAPGTPIPNSVVQYAGSVYYIAADGFKALNGLDLKHIGSNLVDRYFWRVVNQARLYEISSGVDTLNKMIWWAFPTGSAGYADVMLGYKYDDGRWARWFQDVEVVAGIRRGLQSEKFTAFDTAHLLATFTSTAIVNAQFETKALQPVPGRRWQCNGLRVIMDNSGTGITPTGSVQVRVYDTPMPSASQSFLTAVSLNPENNIPLRVAGRWMSFTLTLNCGATGATTTRYVGIELTYEVLGER